MNIFIEFYNQYGNFQISNRANVVMILKKNTTGLGDYRPINIINIIPKLVTKVLANRLRKSLPVLIFTQQIVFIKD